MKAVSNDRVHQWQNFIDDTDQLSFSFTSTYQNYFNKLTLTGMLELVGGPNIISMKLFIKWYSKINLNRIAL